ncbi:MAG: hypothetical protein JSU64_03505, partial [candidate division WOR-3 bacterium]
SEGNTTYLSKANLETTGAEIDLTLATPVVISTLEPVTLSLRLDILASTVIPNFLMHVQDASWFEAEDAISGAPVTVVLQQGSFPVQSGLGYLVVPPTELDVSSIPYVEQRVGWTQRDVSLLTLQLVNPGVPGLTTDIVVASMLVRVTDTNDVVVTEPSQLFERISVSSPLGGTYADHVLDDQDSTSFELALSPLARVAVDTPLELILSADIANGATVGAYRLQVIDSAYFDARDANTSVKIPVIFQSDPLDGGVIVIEAPAESLCVKGTAEFPPTINVGEEDVAALTISLRHAAQPGVSRIQINDLTVHCQNDLRNPLVPATYIDRMQVFQDETEIGSLIDIPTSGNHLTVPLPGLLLEPGDSIGLELRIDVSATAPESFLELLVDGNDVGATDANIGASIIVVADTGSDLPMTSGLTRLLTPPTELVVGLDSRVPAALVAGETDLAFATLSMTNTAATGSGPITVEYMVLRAADLDFVTVPIGEVVTQVRFYVGAQLAGESDSLTVDSTTAYVHLEVPIVLSPEEKYEIDIRADLHEEIGVGSFRVGFSNDDVGVVQPGSAILQIRVEPEAGQTFPMWTEAGNFGASSLKESFSNFPNPFAAGNELTTFVYYLPLDGTVSLKIWTVRGDAVTTIREKSQRNAGLYQDDRWDGRNDLSRVVVNGVYLAELIVEYNSGSQERLLRKVAVVR